MDIVKRNFQLHLAGRFYELANNRAGPAVAGLLRLLAQYPAVQIICEATGGCERDVVAALHQAGIAVSVLIPARVRRFARVPQLRDQRTKTDRLDAAPNRVACGPSRSELWIEPDADCKSSC